MKPLMLLLMLLLSTSTFAYNHSRCRRVLHSSFFFGGISSTTQFSSSTGECSAIGLNEESRKNYFAENFEAIQNDVVKGQGEALTTLLNFNNCSSLPNDTVIGSLKNDFESLFTNDYKKSYENIKPIIGEACSLTI